jgi:hypothetical protein
MVIRDSRSSLATDVPGWFMTAGKRLRPDGRLANLDVALTQKSDVALHKWEKLYRVRDLKNTIVSIEPEFEDILRFMMLFLDVVGAPHPAKSLDLSAWNARYGQLGAFLHAPKRPENTSEDAGWWDRFANLLLEVDRELEEVLAGPYGVIRLNERGRTLFNAWKSGTLTDEEIKGRIERDVSGQQEI